VGVDTGRIRLYGLGSRGRFRYVIIGCNRDPGLDQLKAFKCPTCKNNSPNFDNIHEDDRVSSKERLLENIDVRSRASHNLGDLLSSS
jgi:hypothetical protein